MENKRLSVEELGDDGLDLFHGRRAESTAIPDESLDAHRLRLFTHDDRPDRETTFRCIDWHMIAKSAIRTGHRDNEVQTVWGLIESIM